MSEQAGTFTTLLMVNPPTDLNITSRNMGIFILNSLDPGRIEASTTDSQAERVFRTQSFLDDLNLLAWDLIWEQQVAVQFELEGNSKRVATDPHGRQVISMDIEDRIVFNPENRKSGIDPFDNFTLLQQIRDHIIFHHLAGGDASRTARLMGDAATLLAIEHFVKGVIKRRYAMAEFYLVLETIAHQTPGGRKGLEARMTKGTIDKIARIANDGQLDQRHAPSDPENVQPLPVSAIKDAAAVAKTLISDYVGAIA